MASKSKYYWTKIRDDTIKSPSQFPANEDLEGGSNTDANYRICCSWFQWFETSLYFTSFFQGTPFRLSFDAASGRYVLKSSPLRKKIWAAFHIGGAWILWTEVAAEIRKIQSSHDKMLYFELLNSLGWLGFDYTMKYICLYQMARVQQFFDDLQDSPLLLKLAPKRSKAVNRMYGIGITFYMSTTFMFFPTRWGLFDWTLANYYKTLQSACELYFGISKGLEDEFWYQIMIFFTFVLTSFQYSTVLCGDMVTLAGVVTMKSIAVSIDKAMHEGLVSDEQVYDLIRMQKRLTWKFNRAFGLALSIFVVYSSPYYSLHFSEMFEIPGLMNQLSMFTYLATLCFICKWAIDILFLAKRRKRWLVRQNRVLSLDRATCNVILDDIVWDKFGLGSYYTVNAYVAGQVFSLIATVAIVVIQHS